MKKSKNMLSFSRFDIALIAIAFALIVARFAILPLSPPPFAADESISGAHVATMVTKGTDAHGQSWPLFSEALGGGFTTPIYLYPLTGWAFLFGYEELSLRAFSMATTILAVAITAYATALWLGRRSGLIAAVVGLALPWSWLQGSIAWDPALVPFFVGLAFLFFTLAYKAPSQIRKIIGLVGLPLSLVALTYLYPPLRVTAPLLFAGAYGLMLYQKVITWKVIVASVVSITVLCLPLLDFMLQPSAMTRSQNLLVFHEYPFPLAVIVLITNFLQMLIGPHFLFITGDLNLRHSTGFQGMLGWASLPAVVGLCVIAVRWIRTRKTDQATLILVTLYGIFAGLVGSALTYEGQPHSLRGVAAWPFIVILLVLGWNWILRLKNKKALALSFAIFILATVSYAYDLAFLYPQRSTAAFDNEVYMKIMTSTERPPYPELSMKYYDMLNR